MDPVTGLEVWEKFGSLGLFVALYLSTIWMFIRNLQAQSKQAQENTEKVIRAIEASTSATIQSMEVLKNCKASIDESSRRSETFIAFLKGRDEREA